MVMKLIEVVKKKKPRKGAFKKMSMESKLFLCTKCCVCVRAHKCMCYYNLFVTPNIILIFLGVTNWLLDQEI
jgi:hypothetical protein